MPATLLVLLSALIGDGAAAAPPGHPASGVQPGMPLVAFEIREIRLASPDWRGKLMPKLQEVDRQEGVAVWAVNEEALKELIQDCQADARGNVVTAPAMRVPVGQPAKMTNEETVKYVSSLKRVADGAPGQASKLAFEPQVGEIHSGVRVNVVSSHLKGDALFAKVVIDENRLLKMHTTKYTEAVMTRTEIEYLPGKGVIHDRLFRNVGIGRQSISAQIQVPEVETRRVEGEWLIPGKGALVVSMGPRTRNSGLKTEFEEHLIAITAKPSLESEKFPETAAGVFRNPVYGVTGPKADPAVGRAQFSPRPTVQPGSSAKGR